MKLTQIRQQTCIVCPVQDVFLLILLTKIIGTGNKIAYFRNAIFNRPPICVKFILQAIIMNIPSIIFINSQAMSKYGKNIPCVCIFSFLQ